MTLIQSNKLVNVFAGLLLITIAVLAVASSWNDSAIMDEVSHIPAGYSYIIRKDMRINPEHPPLIKDLSGISALLYSKVSGDKINFPDTSYAWNNEINSQWNFGFNFMYDIGNNADNVIFWSRTPAILIMLFLGFYVFKWTRELYGNKAGLLALFLYSFSPTILAHGRFVTTDVPAAAGIFIATYYFIKASRNLTRRNIIISGMVLGIALLLKFSAFLLIPLFVLLIIIFIITNRIVYNYNNNNNGFQVPGFNFSAKGDILRWEGRQILRLMLILIIAASVLYPVYQYHVWNYPAAPQAREEKNAILEIGDCRHLDIKKYPVNQFRDASCILKTYGNRQLVNLITWMSDKPILRDYGQYLLGLMMVNQRAAGGNTTYFLGEISNRGWYSYFPIVYLIKEPIAMHILTLIALIYALYRFCLYNWKYFRLIFTIGLIPACGAKFKNLFKIINERPAQTAMIIFVIIYWVISIRSPLNIGIRHILPTLPFIYVLIGGNLINIHNKLKVVNYRLFSIFYFLFSILLGGYIYANLSVFPSYLAYFNELIGGPKNGYKYIVDSNLDWGQDLKRLNIWIENYNNCAKIKCSSSLKFGCPDYCYGISKPLPKYGRPINKIKVDYFGGGNPKYYLGDKFESWNGSRSQSESMGSWLAVSATFLQGGRGKAAQGFNESTTHYEWLNKYKPVAVIGYSIFVYNLTEQ